VRRESVYHVVGGGIVDTTYLESFTNY